MQKNKDDQLQFHFGDLGACLPFFAMLATIVLLVVTGNKATKYYWSAGVAGIFVAFIFMKDKKHFSDVMVRGLSNDMFAILTLAFVFAGIFGKALSVGGLANGILWLANSMGVGASWFPALIFVISAILSTCMGTANGTVATMTPVFMPTAVALGCYPPLVMGAIVGGAYFGDNLAPISDTTIVSASTQGTDVASCVRTRVKYSLAAGALTIIVSLVLGHMTMGSPVGVAEAGNISHKSLILITAPILLVFLIVRGASLVASLIVAIAFAVALSLVTGLITLEQVYSTKNGIIAGGVEGMLGIIIFSLFSFCLIQFMTESGVLGRMTGKIMETCKTPMSSELAIIAICILTTVMVPSNTVAMVLCGSIVSKIILSQGMERTRGSNLLDGVCVSTVGLLPYGAGVLLCHSLSVSIGAVGEEFSPTSIIPYSFYCMFLIGVFVFSAVSGWGRRFSNDNAPVAQPATE